MTKGIGFLVLGAALILGPTAAYAASPWTSSSNYGEQTFGKLKFGAKNLLLGWTEIIHEPYEAKQNSQGVLKGIGRGFVNALGDTAGGALHLITFPLPQIDIPLPEGGTDVI